MYDKRDDFDLIQLISRSSMVMSLGVARGVNISQLIRFARASSNLTSAIVIKPLPPISLGRAIVIINFVRRFQGFFFII